MADSSARRVAIIGLDMGDARLVRDWAASGHLPNIASLIERGTWLDLETTAGILHTSTWPSFATGNKPGKHGVYYPYQPSPGHQEAQHIEPDQYGSPTFWSRADREGAMSIVYDVPETFPEIPFGGKAIFEWGTWAWYGTRKSQPDSLLPEMRRRFGPHPLKMEAKRLGLKFPNKNTLEKRLIKSIEQKRASFEWLLKRGDWELAVTVFGETHPTGHYLWPEFAAEDPDTNDSSFDAMRRVYVAIDNAIGQIGASLPDNTSLLLVSGDGVRPNNCGWHLMPDILTQLGYTAAPEQGPGDGKPKILSLAGIKNLMPNKLKRLIADSLPWWLRDKIGASMNSAQIDWSRTRAFPLPTDLEGCIRINLKGREPHGIVEPGEEYASLCKKIAGEMQELINPDTGECAVRDVWIVRDHFDGPFADHLPDITVTWNNSVPINALTSEMMGTVSGESPDPRTGTHSTQAFAIACGEGFPAGGAATGHLVDLAPTALALLGRKWSGMDGHPLCNNQFRGRSSS